MRSICKQLWQHPALPKALPFALYMAFLILESAVSKFPAVADAFDARFIYPGKVACVALLLAYFWKRYEELEKPSLRLPEIVLGIAVGIGVFLLWINMDQGWMSFGHSAGFDPRDARGAIDWSLALPRLLGATLVVPLMEELFWRSFVMRWIAEPEFTKISPARVGLRALLISAVLFGLEHTLWLAGIVAGLAYGWLYMRSRNLWVPILAHGTTNGLLGLWVLYTAQWSFW